MEVLLLANANDIVLLSDTPLVLARKLEALRLYCVQNSLKVKANKTKVVIFMKGRNSAGKRLTYFKFKK